MGFMKTNNVDIIVGNTTYNSLDDYGLAIENTDYLGEPVQDTNNRIYVPGRPGPLYLDDTVFGGTVFTHRPIAIKFGGIRTSEQWDTVISEFRNRFEGRTVKIIFATDPDWYWTGKAVITAFQHQRQLGTFTFEIPAADPYKHKDMTVETTSTISGTYVYLTNNRQKVVPTIVSNAAVELLIGTDSYDIPAGTTTNPDIVLTEGTNEFLFQGSAEITITYTQGSL